MWINIYYISSLNVAIACHACYFISLSENERIRHRITDMYADFVKSVNPKTHVMDCLIQKRIMSEETVQQLRASVTKQECCRAMLHELLNAGNPQAFIVLREALKQDYQYMVNRIDEAKAGAYSSLLTRVHSATKIYTVSQKSSSSSSSRVYLPSEKHTCAHQM